MDQSELKENLQIVLDKEEADFTTQGYSYFAQGSHATKITYPNAEMLIDLFSMISSDDALKTLFLDALKETIREAVDYDCVIEGQIVWVGTSGVAFYTLVRLGYINDAIECLKQRQEGCNNVYRLLLSIIDEHYFNASQIALISSIVKDGNHRSEFAGYLRTKIAYSRFELLKTKIRTTNVEINQDKKAVSEKIGVIGLSDNYNELLNSMEDFIADSSKVVNAGMISTLRAFMADLLKDIALRIAEAEHEEIPKLQDRGEMGNIRSYLKKRLELTDADDKFIDSFVDILHSEGGHAFLSEKEYFRLSRNIAIEIALFVLSKYQKKYK